MADPTYSSTISELRARIDAAPEPIDPSVQVIKVHRTELAALLDVAECVPDLLRWMARKNSGDPKLDPEEYYIESESAKVRMKALDAVIPQN